MMSPFARFLWEVASGRPAPIPPLPTIPGLYVARIADEVGVTVYRLDESGRWSLVHEGLTADEVSARVGVRPLVRLIRESDGDL